MWQSCRERSYVVQTFHWWLAALALSLCGSCAKAYVWMDTLK